MKDKHYTPLISEFHVGFEFECKLNSGEWEKMVFQPGGQFLHRFVEEGYFTEEGNTRVKHIDREDIESFGFEFVDSNAQYFNFNGFNLEIKKDNWITIYEDKSADEYCFRGTAKNKSELKRILQQIGAI